MECSSTCECRVCLVANTQQLHSGKLTRSEASRKRLYGITLQQLLDRNGHDLCEICTKRKAICVDHDHKTGDVRGALCRTCNMVLHFFESKTWMAAATKYLSRATRPGS